MKPEFLQKIIANNTVEQYLIFLAISVAAFLVFKIFLSLGLRKLSKLAKKTDTKVDDLIITSLEHIQWPIFTLILIITAKNALFLNPTIANILDVLIVAIVTYQFVKVGVLIVTYGTDSIINKKEAKSNKAQIIILSKIIKGVLWLGGGTLFLSNIGYDVSSIVAGLGIGSIAIALALQNILGDIFSSFSIYLDKPFQIGDSIQIGENKGKVVHIGIKTTRIITLQGEELVVPNNMITNKELHNYGKLKQRRNKVSLGLRYDTSSAKLKKAKAIVKEIFKDLKTAKLSRINFAEFTDSSLKLELVYFVLSSEYSDFMNVQESVNFSIKEAFEKEEIEFAFPTQTIVVEK